MADDVAITAGSGTTIAADERTVGGVSVKIQRVADIATATQAVGAAAPTSTETAVSTARDTRRALFIYNAGTVTCYIGPTGVSSANGVPLEPGAAITVLSDDAWFGRTVAGTGDLRYIDYYD